VVGLRTPAALDRSIEATLRRDRGVVVASLLLIVALAWLYLWREATAMDHMDMGTMAMAGMPQGWDAIFLTFVMWAVMMVGMMLPSAAPVILFYAAMVRKSDERGIVLPAVWIFTAGYLAVWTGFSLAAAVLQIALESAGLITPMMVSASRGLSAAILIAAGIYQWLPLKQVCLSKCRHPLQFFLTRWRSGAIGAFRMGAKHGIYCVGCCGMLMLLLFVAGVMNLVWVAFIAAIVLVERLLPAGKVTSRITSVALLLSGLFLLIKP
jgi:predicted metal-binding membrane protein